MYSVGLLLWSQCEVHLCELKAHGTASYSYITSFQGYTAVNVIFFFAKVSSPNLKLHLKKSRNNNGGLRHETKDGIVVWRKQAQPR